jgi:hypothetical protein
MLPLLLIVMALATTSSSADQLSEEERIHEYHYRRHTWPPKLTDYVPNTPGWQSLFEKRLTQLSYISDLEAKYNGYMSVVHSALIAPNFTEYGWGLTRAPQGLVDALVDNLQRGLASPDTLQEEYQPFDVEDEYPDQKPLMVHNYHLNNRAMYELQSIHESWSGTKLIPNNAYGLRVYRNESKLLMHIDQSSTHVISSILHVGHDPNGEPWPLVIEDLHGNVNEVYLETGDMLLYESSKCFHGRPKRYNGQWYSSLFTHYYPVDWRAEEIEMDTHYRVPPDWTDVPTKEEEGDDELLPTLVVMETSFSEPECEYGWCGMRNTLKWERPPDGLEVGQVLSGDGKIQSLRLENEEVVNVDKEVADTSASVNEESNYEL